MLAREAAEARTEAAIQEVAAMADQVDDKVRETKLRLLAEKASVQTELEVQLAAAQGERDAAVGHVVECRVQVKEKEQVAQEAEEAREAMQLELAEAREAMEQERKRRAAEGEAVRVAQQECSDARLATLEAVGREVASKVAGQVQQQQAEAIEVTAGPGQGWG